MCSVYTDRHKLILFIQNNVTTALTSNYVVDYVTAEADYTAAHKIQFIDLLIQSKR